MKAFLIVGGQPAQRSQLASALYQDAGGGEMQLDIRAWNDIRFYLKLGNANPLPDRQVLVLCSPSLALGQFARNYRRKYGKLKYLSLTIIEIT